MAAGLTRDVVKSAVEECNNAIHSIDDGIGELDIIEELQGYSNQLAEIWQTENGENTINGLNKVIRGLKTYTDSLKRAMENIKNDTYEYTESSTTEYKHPGEW